MFAHLHTRSWFSFLAGGSSPEYLAHQAAKLGIPALALTDRHGVYGIARFYRACRLLGIKPIYGAEITLEDAPVVLVARNNDGYANLCSLLTDAHSRDRLEPRITLDELAAKSSDLFCLTGGRNARLWQLAEGRDMPRARWWIGSLRAIFGRRLFVELSHHGRRGDTFTNAILYRLADETETEIVATGDVQYAIAEDYKRYDLLSCVRLGHTVFEAHRERPVNAEAFLRSEEALRRMIPTQKPLTR